MTEKLNLVVIPENDLRALQEDIRLIRESISKKSETEFSESYIESKNIPNLLGISLKTWQNYRDKGVLPFIQFGSKIWVKRADLEAFLDKHYINRKTA